ARGARRHRARCADPGPVAERRHHPRGDRRRLESSRSGDPLMPDDPRHVSRKLTEGPDRAPARAMLKAIGFTSEDLSRPRGAMALLRLNLPSLLLYGGSIAPGRFEGRDVTIQDVFEAVGAHAAGKMSSQSLAQLEDVACPGAGACGGQYTANTMALACEVLGLGPVGYASIPAVDSRKGDASRAAGALVVDLLRKKQRPLDVVRRVSFENAIAAVAG